MRKEVAVRTLLGLVVIGALALATQAVAATFAVVPNTSGSYNAVLIQEADDPRVFAVDMFVRSTDGAAISIASDSENPFDRVVMNESPTGFQSTALIGGTDLEGVGRGGSIKLGEIDWDGSGTLSLAGASQAIDSRGAAIPINNPSGCRLRTGDQVLGGSDDNQNGIVNRCECGDLNQDGFQKNADLVLLFECITTGQYQGNSEPCATRAFNGDTNGDGYLLKSDLVRIFISITDPSRTKTFVCPARPQPID